VKLKSDIHFNHLNKLTNINAMIYNFQDLRNQ